MKYFLVIFIFISAVTRIVAQQQVRTQEQTNAQLAVAYYNSKDYEKAVPLLKEVYENVRNSYYYRLYIISLVELKRFEEAENGVREEIEKLKNSNPVYQVYLGYVFEAQNKNDEAEERYKEAIEIIRPNKGSFQNTANTFIQWGNYEYAKNTYLKGRSVLPDEQFNYQLATTYYYLRDYDLMMEEYLNLLKHDEGQLSRVQSNLSSVMRLDIDDELRNKYRGQVLRRIQSEPNIMGYNRLLIWFFLQEKKFASALRQSVALDRRTGEEDARIIQLGRMALNNRNYADAQNAYEYILGKGEENQFYRQAFIQNIHSSYLEYITELSGNLDEGKNLSLLFQNGLEYLGFGAVSFNLIQEYAHLLAFYLGETDKAIEILEKGLKIPRLKPEQSGVLKAEMADVYVYSNDPWEATLLYSQVIDANKNNSLGDEVKLKKAKLSYYLGNFSWAKAQLDVLKASTSKLTANDALDLSLLIGNNLNLDTTAVPLQMFARADLLFFRNEDSLAMATLDSLYEMYPYHTLVDDILFRKSKIETNKQNYALAAEYLEQIVDYFSYDLLADDALFELASLYDYHLGEKEKAKDLYRQMLSDYPGSVFVDESRIKYRELREIYPDEENEINKEDFFMNGIVLPAVEGNEEQ